MIKGILIAIAIIAAIIGGIWWFSQSMDKDLEGY